MTVALTHVHQFVGDRGHRAPKDLSVVWSSCSCGLGVRKRYLNGTLYEVRVRLAGGIDWVDPVTLLTVDLPLIVCPRCEGQRYDRGNCGLCGSLGVLQEEGERL